MKSNLVQKLLLLTFWLLGAKNLSAQDVHYYELWREEYFTQATTNRASTTSDVAHELGGEVVAAYSGALLSASLKIPQHTSLALTASGDNFYLENNSGGEIVLSAPAPAGSYQFNVQEASQGNKTYLFTLPGPAIGLLPLRIANLPAAQAIDAAQTFTLQWDKTINSGPHDYLRLHIFDTNDTLVFSQSDISLTTTNLDIPPGTLQPNTPYIGYLAVLHVFSLINTKSPGSETFERKLTRFRLQTLNPAGLIKFSSSVVTVSETDGAAYVKVRRTGGATGAVTVDYFTDDATAHSNVNYTTVSGTLTFNDGETAQTIIVPLLNDGPNAGPVTAHLTLTNVTGGADLSTEPHAVLTIGDSANNIPAGANACLLGRVEFFDQDGTNTPSQAGRSVTSRFYTDVHPRYPGGVSYGFLLLPNSTIATLDRSFANYQGFLNYSQDFPSTTALNAAFKPGRYTLLFESASGLPVAPTLSMGAETQITTPYLTNWTAAQTIDPTQNFTLKWARFAGATTNDAVHLLLWDTNGEYLIYTPDEFEAGVLPGTTTSYTIPAHTLAYGNTYRLNIIFSKMANAASSAALGFSCGSASVRTTILSITTLPPP